MPFPDSSAWVVRSVCASLLALVFASPSLAEPGKLRERLTPEVMAVVYPGAERLGMEEGSPPAIAVFKGDQIVAYVFSTLDIIAATGYSTTPFDVIAGVDLSGRITGAKVVFHQESMIVHDRVRERQLDTLLAREAWAIAGLGVIFGAVYMLWMFKRVFFGEPGELVKDEHHPLHDLNAREIITMAPLIVLIFWMGLFPNTFLDYSKASIEHFVQNRDNYRLVETQPILDTTKPEAVAKAGVNQ